MAIPNTFTFKASDVCAELNIDGIGGGTPTASINCFLDIAPEVTYCSAYSGTTSCLRNFRGYNLQTSYTFTRNEVMQNEMIYNPVTESMWTGFGQSTPVLAEICNDGTVVEHTITCGAQYLALDGSCNIWYTSGFYKRGARLNVSTCNEECIFTGLAGCPVGIIFDGTQFWTPNFCVQDTAQRCCYSTISTAGVVTNHSCNCLCFPRDMVYDGMNIWVTELGGQGIYKIDPSTCVFTCVATLSFSPYKLVFDGTDIWGLGTNSSYIYKVTTGGTVTCYTDPAGSNSSVRNMIVSSHPTKPTYVWIDGTNLDCIKYRIDPSNGCWWGIVSPDERNVNTAMAYNCDTYYLWSVQSLSCIYKLGVY